MSHIFAEISNSNNASYKFSEKMKEEEKVNSDKISLDLKLARATPLTVSMTPNEELRGN